MLKFRHNNNNHVKLISVSLVFTKQHHKSLYHKFKSNMQYWVIIEVNQLMKFKRITKFKEKEKISGNVISLNINKFIYKRKASLKFISFLSDMLSHILHHNIRDYCRCLAYILKKIFMILLSSVQYYIQMKEQCLITLLTLTVAH